MNFQGYTVGVGFVVGALVGSSGIGAAALMMPYLLFVLKLTPMEAVGTDMVFAMTTKLVGTLKHMRMRTIAWRYVGLLFAGSGPSALLSLWLLYRFRSVDLNAANGFVGRLLGVTILLVAVMLLWNSLKKGTQQQAAGRVFVRKTDGGRRWVDATTGIQRAWIDRKRGMAVLICFGALVGSLVSFTSIGAGSLIFVVLNASAPLTAIRLVGTDVAHAFFLSLVNAVAHLQSGNVVVSALVPLLIGSLPGVYLGSTFGAKVPDRWIRRLIGILLIGASLRLIYN